MTPYDYDTILYPDLLLKMEGFTDRMEYELDITRNASFASYISGNLDPKKMAKSVNEFWPKDTKKGPHDKKISDAKRDRLARAIRKYNENAT